MLRIPAVLMLTICAGGVAWAQGDTLQMGGVDQSRFEAAGKPGRGMSQDRVRSVYGAPNSTEAAVGDPPISRWHYDEFVVFFEHDKVIHAVSKR